MGRRRGRGSSTVSSVVLGERLVASIRYRENCRETKTTDIPLRKGDHPGVSTGQQAVEGSRRASNSQKGHHPIKHCERFSTDDACAMSLST